MNHPCARLLILGLKIMIMICIAVILTGLGVYLIGDEQTEFVHLTSGEILSFALAFLLLIPVYILSVMSYGYFRTRDYRMGFWVAAILFFTLTGTYILFLIKNY